VVNLHNALEQRLIVVVDVRKRERYGCGKRRRICVTGEEAENGLQRTVRQNNRSKPVKNTEKISRKGKQAISE
jgi:hypothetical protein